MMIGMLVAVSVLTAQVWPPAEWNRADIETVRLSPDRFVNLPMAVRTELNDRGCTVPQPFTATAERSENVIRGRFISTGSSDWAILCSQQRRSTILVFRGGGATTIDELAAGDDADWLELVGPGEIGYSRGMYVASSERIRRHNPNPDRPLPVLDHDGIGDAFIEKGSVIWYWAGDRWLKLAGIDAPISRSNTRIEPTRR